MQLKTIKIDCAPEANGSNWKSIDWKKVEKSVKLLQRRIAKAKREGKHGKARSLQWILTHSFHAKFWVVMENNKYKIHLIRYADDFIVTTYNKEVLEYKVKLLIEKFPATRGLQLSLEKTKITHVTEGFDFP